MGNDQPYAVSLTLVPQPSCGTPIALPATDNVTVWGYTLGASNNASMCGSGPSQWYSWIAPSDGEALFDTTYANFGQSHPYDNVLGLYQQCGAQPVACAQNTQDQNVEAIRQRVAAGQEYYIQVTYAFTLLALTC